MFVVIKVLETSWVTFDASVSLNNLLLTSIDNPPLGSFTINFVASIALTSMKVNDKISKKLYVLKKIKQH
jgi:hypothetical protein